MPEPDWAGQPQGSKKARYMEAWEAALSSPDSAEILGLRQLFGRSHRGRATAQEQRHDASSFLAEFFTLRLEHRVGGPVAQRVGEERVLLLRSDRTGPIAKIIFSSKPSNQIGGLSGVEEQSQEEADLEHMAQARIHLLEVKVPYRGFDLGGLLFSEAVRSLRDSYADDQGHENGADGETDDSRGTRRRAIWKSVRCQLDAEEDVRRHNKLIRFYEDLGCHVKPKAKVQYINNNDGETYRKISMQLALWSDVDACFGSWRRQHNSCLSLGQAFLPVRLLEASGRTVTLSCQEEMLSRRVDWLVLDDGKGCVSFRTTHGEYLRVDSCGRCRVSSAPNDDAAVDEYEKPTQKEHSSFRLHQVSDLLQSDEFSEDDSALSIAKQKELWLLESAHGTFLTAERHHSLYCSKIPAFWQADDKTMSITCTSDTPSRRQHYRKTWTRQTVAFVEKMRERYCSFVLTRMSIRHALDMLQDIEFDPFRIGRPGRRTLPSLRTLCYRTAEACRAAGHPDWFQFIGLVHDLAKVLNFVDVATAAQSEDDYDWTITSRSRVVGCSSPEETTFYEFRKLNPDENDARFCTSRGMYSPHCGLSNVLLAWTGPEYMYHMLQHNKSTVPDEGMAMLRYFSLLDWHGRGEYGHLANENDEHHREYAAEFDSIRRSVRQGKGDDDDMSDDACNNLWGEYYSDLVAKYVGDTELMW